MAKATTKAAKKSAASAKKSTAQKAAGSKAGTNSSKGATAVKKASPAKRANAKKAPAKAKGKVQLDKFLEGQLKLLDEERATYVRQAETLQAEADSLTEDREPGDVQFDEESGEGDTVAVERERDLALSAQARAAVEEIDAAVEKIYDGSYGKCANCGRAIPKERLKALPYASLCVHCKSGDLGLGG